MQLYIQNCKEYIEGRIEEVDIHLQDGIYSRVSSFKEGIKVISGENLLIAPSFCDLHVHLRQPGFSYKETIYTGTKAAARGGFTTVCAMPNLNPVPDNIENIKKQLRSIKEDAIVEVIPYASITKAQRGKELSDIEKLSEFCCGYSDDGNGLENKEIMKTAMLKIATTNRILAAHVEDNSLMIPNAVIHEGEAAKRFNVVGMPSKTEYIQLKRDIDLVKETGVRYHMCHISTAQSVDIIRDAKRQGLPVTCEVTPHHLAFCDADIIEDSGRFKMNPPLRGSEDRAEILKGIADGTIDIIATDHAPHSKSEKEKGLKSSAFGTVGLETAFAAANTYLVDKKIILLERLIHMMSDLPRQILKQKTVEGFVLLDLKAEKKVNPNDFLSLGRSTPFEGLMLKGSVLLTVKEGRVIYMDGGYFGD